MPSWALAGECNLTRIAALDINLDEAGDPYVPMTIAGQKVNLLIDTGGIFSTITEQSAQLLDLKELPAFSSGEKMFGGKSINKFVEAQDINLGGLKAERMPMQIIPDHFLATGIGGTLAPNILRHYDADFDFGHGKFNLFSPDHCEGKVIYWTDDPYAAIAVSIDGNGHIQVPIQLDGQEIRAAVDTGTWRSLLSLETAKRLFSIADNDPNLKQLKVDEHGTWFRYPFKQLTFQGGTVTDPDILLISEKDSRFSPDAPKFFIGMSTLSQLHIYIAYKEKKLYVTPASAH